MNRWIIICDGPSTRLVDLSLAKNVHTVGTHRRLDPGNKDKAWLVPEYMLFNDMEVYMEQINNVDAVRPRPKLWVQEGGIVPGKNNAQGLFPEKLNHFQWETFRHTPHRGGVNEFPDDGTVNMYSLNSGVAALQVAYHHGATEIGLIGMDLMYPKEGFTHSCGKPRGASDVSFHRAMEWFAMQADRFRTGTPKVYNLSPDLDAPLYLVLKHKDWNEFCSPQVELQS